MEFFRIRKDIDFMRHAMVFNIISLAVFLLSVFFLVTRGLHLGVEFTGGTVLELSYGHTADVNAVRSAQFRPYSEGGVAQAVWVVVPIDFVLR